MRHLLVNDWVMQVLNSYIDDLSRGNDVTTSKVEFFVEEDKQLKHIVAELPSYGSLGPLFYAFGLITADELSSGVGAYHGGTVFPPIATCILQRLEMFADTVGGEAASVTN